MGSPGNYLVLSSHGSCEGHGIFVAFFIDSIVVIFLRIHLWKFSGRPFANLFLDLQDLNQCIYILGMLVTPSSSPLMKGKYDLHFIKILLWPSYNLFEYSQTLQKIKRLKSDIIDESVHSWQYKGICYWWITSD